jgi:hypothetical protein
VRIARKCYRFLMMAFGAFCLGFWIADLIKMLGSWGIERIVTVLIRFFA